MDYDLDRMRSPVYGKNIKFIARTEGDPCSRPLHEKHIFWF